MSIKLSKCQYYYFQLRTPQLKYNNEPIFHKYVRPREYSSLNVNHSICRLVGNIIGNLLNRWKFRGMGYIVVIFFLILVFWIG